MPCFSTNKRSCMASDRNHAHLIRLQSTTYGEVSRPPLLSIGNRAWIRLKSIVAAATIQIMKIAWVTYLGALLYLLQTTYFRINIMQVKIIHCHYVYRALASSQLCNLLCCPLVRKWYTWRSQCLVATTSRLKEGEREGKVALHGPFEDRPHFHGYIIHRHIWS